MNLLNNLTIKNLKLNKKRTIVTIIGIMLSVALITTVASIYSSGIKSLIKFETREKGNFHVSYFDVPALELETFKNNRSVDTLNLVKNIGYAKIDSKNEYKPYAYVKALTPKSLNNLSIKLVEGRLPENENEIVIPTHLKTNGRLVLNVDDSITLDIGKRVNSEGYELNQSNPYNDDGTDESLKEEIIETQSKTYKIVGIIERPASNIEEYSAPGFTFITYIDEENIDDNMDIYVKYTKEGTKNAYKVTAGILDVDKNLFEKAYKTGNISEEEALKLSEETDKTYRFTFNNYLIGLETDPIRTSSVGGLGTVVIIVMIIIVFTSIFCIRNSFDISITEKIKQYGMLRSIGATKKQIKKNVFYEASILGIIGIPLGILLGFLASFLLIIISNYYLNGMFSANLELEFSFSLIAVFVAIILGIITIYFSAFKSARKASHISPIDSIRNSAGVKINYKKIKSPRIIKKVFGMGGEISYKNLKRNKKKYRTTVISIIVSVCIFIALSSFMNMAFDTVDGELKISEYNISFHKYNYDEKDYDKYERTTKLDNIDDYTILRQASFIFKNPNFNKEYLDWVNFESEEEYINIYALGKEQYKKYIKSLGLDYDNMKDKAILNDYSKVSKYEEKAKKNVSKNMRIYDYKIGDIISGNINNDDVVDVKIGFITNNKPFGLKNVDGIELIVSDEYFEEIATARILEIVYKSSNANKLQDDIEEYLKGEDSYSIRNIEENVKMMNNLFTLVGIFLYGFIIVISLIGITNIFNTITTNMELRKQEFAMLKSVGMTKYEFNRMIRLESLFMGVKSLLFGIPLGITLSYIIYHFLSGESNMPYKLPLLAILLAITAVFILISLIMKYSMNKINKQNTIETIRNENI